MTCTGDEIMNNRMMADQVSPERSSLARALFVVGGGQDDEREESRLRPVPVWAVIQSVLVVLCAGLLCAVTVLHWGGMIDHVVVPWMACGVILWGVVIISALRGYVTRQRVGDVVDVCVVAFLGYAFFSYLNTGAGYAARLEWMWMWTYAGVFLGLRYGLHSRHFMIGFLIFLVLVAVAVCLYGFLHKGQSTYLIWGQLRPDYGVRMSGTFGCPNHFANFLAMMVPVALLLGTYSKLPWPVRIVFFYLAAMFTLGIFWSVSRGGYIAWTFGMTLICGFLFRMVRVAWWWKLLAVLGVVAGVVLTIARNDFVLGRLESTLGGDIRLQLIVDSIRIWKEDRWFGTGMASFDALHMRLPEFTTGRAIYTHNDYFNTLSDYGMIGLGLVLLFLAAYTLTLVWSGFSLRSERETVLWRAGLCVLVAMAAHEFVDFNLHIPACALIFFSVLGMALGKTFRQRSLSMHWVSGAPLLLAAGVFMWSMVAPLMWQTWQGQRLASLTDDEMRQLPFEELRSLADQVHAVDPGNPNVQLPFADALRVRAFSRYKELKDSGSRSLTAHREMDQIARHALEIYSRVYETNPLMDTVLIQKAMTLDAVGQYRQASFYYAKALSLRPHSGNFHFAVGHHYLTQERYDEALESFRKAGRQAVQHNPNIAEQLKQAHQMVRNIESLKALKARSSAP